MKGSNSYLVYDTQISLALPNIDHPITWSIQKRYTDFYELDQTLKVFLGIKYLPPLPGKKLNLDEKAQHDRKSGLEFYLKSLLDDRNYHHYSLFNFIGIQKDHLEEFKSIF